jgi:hypothetical protein
LTVLIYWKVAFQARDPLCGTRHGIINYHFAFLTFTITLAQDNRAHENFNRPDAFEIYPAFTGGLVES